MIYRYLQAAVPFFVVPQTSQIRHLQRSFRYIPAFFTNSFVKSTPFWPCYLIKTTLVKKNIISTKIVTVILPTSSTFQA